MRADAILTYTDKIATAHTDTVEDDGTKYATDIIMQVAYPGQAVTLGRQDNVAVTISLSGNPGCPRNDRDAVTFDVYPEDLDRLVATLTAVIAEARRSGVLPAPPSA